MFGLGLCLLCESTFDVYVNVKAGRFFFHLVLNLVIASALTSNNAYGWHVLIICLTLL